MKEKQTAIKKQEFKDFNEEEEHKCCKCGKKAYIYDGRRLYGEWFCGNCWK